ncbi:MAG: hypothetical protein HFJ57_00510 [Clostridia bacterium]|nr:hypothetical protein [Clostridia bacterium]
MINLLLVEDDFTRCKNIVNLITEKHQDIKIYKIATSIKESLEMLSDKEIDMILVNSKIYTFSKIRYSIPNLKIRHFKQYVLINYSNVNLQIIDNNNNILVSTKGHKYNFDILKESIWSELKFLNYNLSYKGTMYIAEAILELFDSNNTYNENLNREIYPIIAKKYSKTVNNIKCNITNSTQIMKINCNTEKLEKYFLNNNPTVKQIIFIVFQKVNSKLNSNATFLKTGRL